MKLFVNGIENALRIKRTFSAVVVTGRVKMGHSGAGQNGPLF